MTIYHDGKNFVGGLKKSGHKKRRAQRQKKKIKKAKKSGDNEKATQLKDKRKKTKRQIHKADKQATRSGVDIGKRFVKAGASVATGNPAGAVVEFI